MKSDNARQALKGIRQNSRVASFATAAGLTYDPKSWAVGVWTPKSDNARQALKGIRQNSRVASFATAAGLTYDPKSWAVGVWTPNQK